MLRKYNKTFKPKNVPEFLFPFAQRKIENFTNTENNVIKYDLYRFIKSNDIIKKSIKYEMWICESGNFQVSMNACDIDAEYRCLVHKGELIAIQPYSISSFVYPDVKNIKEIIYT